MRERPDAKSRVRPVSLCRARDGDSLVSKRPDWAELHEGNAMCPTRPTTGLRLSRINPLARLLTGRLPRVGIVTHVGRNRLLVITTLISATLTALAACGAPLGTSPSAPSISPQVVASAPSASASGSVVQSYTTTSFKVPLVVVVDPLLKSPPNPDSPG